jgi:protein-S-isoprenylcysteine O-methyltransferase Ste14
MEVRPKPDAAGGVPAPLVPVAVLVAGALLQRAIALPTWSSAWRWPLGAALVLAGLTFGLGALRLMRRSQVSVNPYRSTTSLLVEGPFRLSRNPMYVSIVLYLLAFSLWFRLPWALALTPVAIVVLHLGCVVPEERHLERRFGDDYRRYRARVRAWI